MDFNTEQRFRQLLASFVFLLTLLLTSQAKAILLQALPSASEVVVGDAFQIDIVISGLESPPLNELIRGYHLDLAYAPELATATDVVFGDLLGLGSPLSPILQKSAMNSGDVMLEEVSLWSDSILAAAQPDSFILASIDFLATNEGAMNFDFLPYLNFGIDIKGSGSQLLSLESVGGVVNIISVNIPEPATGLLFGTALLGLYLTQKRRSIPQ